MRGKRSLAGLTLVLSMLGAGTALAAVEGDYDTTFSGDGKLATDFGGSSFTVRDSALDFNGKLVVVGRSGVAIAVQRYNPDGSLDGSFGGGDGMVTVDSPGTKLSEEAQAVAIDPATGNLLIVGDVTVSSGPAAELDFVVARLEPDGDLDPSFDGPGGSGNGVFRLDFLDTENASDVIDNDGKLVFAGVLFDGTTQSIRVVQLSSTGAFDTASFGSPNGYFDFQWATGVNSLVTALDQQDDGKLIVVGQPNGTGAYGVARLTTAGALDTSFNSGGTTPGIARPALPAGYFQADAFAAQIDSGGGVVVAGAIEASVTFDADPFISRVTSSGTLDGTFGTSSGYSILPLAGDISTFGSLELLGGGKLFAGGTVGPVADRDQFAARYTGTGGLDTTFAAPAGFKTFDPGVPSNVDSSPVSPNGTAYLVGQGHDPGPGELGISAVCVTVPPACPTPAAPGVTPTPPQPATGPTGLRAAALKKCAKIKSKRKKKRCKKRARALPV